MIKGLPVVLLDCFVSEITLSTVLWPSVPFCCSDLPARTVMWLISSGVGFNDGCIDHV